MDDNIVCPDCGGDGRHPELPAPSKCHRCDGEGEIPSSEEPVDDNRSEAGVILGLPILIRQSRVEEILGISRGNLPKYMVPEPVYVRPQQWRLQDVELWARSTGKRRIEAA